MKKSAFSLVLLLGLCSISCDKEGKDADNGQNTKTEESQSSITKKRNEAPSYPTSLNIRYIDMDTLTKYYNLAKDANDLAVRETSSFQSAYQNHQTKIAKMAQSIDDKMRNNKYLSQEEYETDMATYNKLQSDAQVDMDRRERELNQKLAMQQNEVMDSIESYIIDYNQNNGYDAILFRSVGIYFNPALDITDEVVKGLNARYNKK